MAINISDHFLEANTARQFGLKTLIRLAPVRRKLNPALRAVLPKRARALESPCIVTDAFDAAAAHYQEHRCFRDDLEKQVKEHASELDEKRTKLEEIHRS